LLDVDLPLLSWLTEVSSDNGYKTTLMSLFELRTSIVNFNETFVSAVFITKNKCIRLQVNCAIFRDLGIYSLSVVMVFMCYDCNGTEMIIFCNAFIAFDTWVCIPPSLYTVSKKDTTQPPTIISTAVVAFQ